MTLNDYIEKFKSVDMVGRTPIDVYQELLSIKQEYYLDTDDDGLDAIYTETDSELTQEDVMEILKNKGWKAVWKYLHTIPEKAIDQPYFIVDMDRLRPIDWDDVAELQTTMIKTLRDKQVQSPKKEQLIEVLDYLGTARNIIDKLIDSEDKTSEAN